MKKTIAMICTALFAAVALAHTWTEWTEGTWTDPKTGITWTYTVSDGEVAAGDFNGNGKFDNADRNFGDLLQERMLIYE